MKSPRCCNAPGAFYIYREPRIVNHEGGDNLVMAVPVLAIRGRGMADAFLAVDYSGYGPGRYPNVYQPSDVCNQASNLRRASPRWEMAFFSSAEISAMVQS